LENSYYSILCKYISHRTNLDNVVALVNDRVQLYKQIKQNIDQANIIKTLLYEYPCDTGALEKIGKTVKADVRYIVFSKPIEELIQDMENIYNLPF
jgi:pyoverdine/dityrosine biosynthesis protein Dit1